MFCFFRGAKKIAAKSKNKRQHQPRLAAAQSEVNRPLLLVSGSYHQLNHQRELKRREGHFLPFRIRTGLEQPASINFGKNGEDEKVASSEAQRRRRHAFAAGAAAAPGGVVEGSASGSGCNR